MSQFEDEYCLFSITHPFSWCWWCGRDDWSRPAGWHAPWLIERAHIVNKPRLEDSRCVVLLCSLCHRLEHGLDVAIDDRPPYGPNLAHLVWLKRTFDPDRYDREILQRCTIGHVPRAVRPPVDIQRSYESRRGGYPCAKK